MNQLFPAPASMRSSAKARASSMRRGLLLSGVSGLALFSGALPLHAQMLVGSASTSVPSASLSSRDTLNKARAQEAAGSVALAAVLYREAFAASPRDVTVARELAHFYSRQHRLEEASMAWKCVLQLQANDTEAKRELATIASRIPVTVQSAGTGVSNVDPLPQVVGIKPQTTALAQTRMASVAQLPSVTTASVAKLAAPSATSSSRSLAPSAPVLSPLPPSKNVSAIPFILPAQRTVKVADENRIAAFRYVNQGANFLQQKPSNASRALLAYQHGERLDPNNIYATPGIAISQVILGKFGDAINTYRRYLPLATNESRLSALRGLADALTYNGQDRHYSENLQYRQALGVNAYILSHYLPIPYPNSYQLKGRKLKSAIERAQARMADRVAAAYQNGQIYTYVKDYNRANTAFQLAVSMDPKRADILTTWGEMLSYRRDARAVRVLSSALSLQHGNPRATVALGNYYLYSGQFQKAIPLLSSVVQAQPENVLALIALGDAFTYNGQPDQALNQYSRALAQRPKAPEYARASLGLGRALVYVGRYDEGKRILTPIVASNPGNTQALEALALAQARTRSVYATGSYTKLLALQKNPADRARIYASIGDTQLSANRLQDAVQSYQQAAQLAPSNVGINTVYAQLLYYTDQSAAAVSAAQRVLALDSKNLQAKVVLLEASLKTGDQATASQLATELENVSPTNARDSLDLALALRDANNNNAAFRLLSLANGQKRDRDTTIRLAAATRDVRDYQTSLALYQQILTKNPADSEARLGYVKTLFWSNDKASLPLAQTQIQSVLTQTPNDKDAQILAAQIDLEIGTPESREESARLANAVLVSDPSNADARAILGDVLVALQRYDEAVPQLQAAVNASSGKPGEADTRLKLARALNYARNTDGSIEQYRQLIALASVDVTPRLELAEILLNNARYTEAEALYNEVLVLRRSAMLLPAVRRALASNSLQSLSPRTLEGSPLVHTFSVALVKPRAAKHRAVVDNPSLASKKRVFLAQNPTVSSPPTPAAEGQGPRVDVNPVPSTTAPTPETPPTEAPTTDVPTVQDPVVTPPATGPTQPVSPTQPGGTDTPEVAPPQQLQPTEPTTPAAPTPVPAPTDTIGAPGTQRLVPGTLVDSPVLTPPDVQGIALRGLGESRRRQGRFQEASDYYSQALTLNPNDYPARLGYAQSLRGLGQFPNALAQVQQVLSGLGQATNVGALALQAQLLADTGRTAEAKTQLDSLVASLNDKTPLEYYIQIAVALDSVGNYSTALDVLNRGSQQYPSDSSLARLRAETLRFSGQNDAALTLYDQILSANPKDVDAALGKARTYNYVNRLPEAAAAYQQVLDISSTNSTAQRELAGVSTRRGNYDAALTLYDQLLSANPNDVDSTLGKARAYNYSNRLPEAEAAYRQVLALDTSLDANNVAAQGELADILGRRGNYTESITFYQSAISASPSDLALRVNLARLQRRSNQSTEAEATLNQVLDADPNNVDALIERGLIRGNNGTYAAGLADLNRAQSLAPDNQAVQLGLAQLQLYSGNYLDSITTYQAYLTRNPTDARARVEFAQALSYANRTKEALDEVDNVLKQTPDDVRAQLVQADIYARTGRAPDAVKIYNTLLAQDPQNSQARIGLGDALLYSRRYTDAITTYDQLLQTDPNNLPAKISRARALSYAGRSDEAVAALRAIVAADASNVTARLALAEVGANSGKATLQRDSIGEYRAILKDYPDNLTAQLGLARVLSYRGEYAESSTIVEKILATNPGNNEARLVLADAQRYSGKPFDAQKNYKLITHSNGVSSTVLNSANAGLSGVQSVTAPLLGIGGSHYADTNGVRLNSATASATLRTRALTIGVLAEDGKFRQNNLAERNRRNIGILLARQFGPFAAQLVVSRLKYEGVSEKTLFNLTVNRDFTPRKRINLSVARRDIFESDDAVAQGITATTVNLTGSFPLGKRFDLDATGTYYDYSDNNSRITLSPALMFRFKPTNPSLRVGLGYIYDNTDEPRDEPFVYYTPQNFNAVAILADYIVTTGKTRYGLSGAVPLTGSTGQNGINRPADTLFGFLERDLGDRLTFNIRGGIVRVPNGDFRSNQISSGLNLSF